jgi:hypothetical protein
VVNEVARPPRVFISYAHESDEHRDQVRDLWLFLRSQGVDARVDRVSAERRRDVALWMADQIRWADHVLVVASATYRERAEGRCGPDRGRGVQFEARLIRDAFYRNQHVLDRFVPVVLPGQSTAGVPDFLAPATCTVYEVEDFTVAGAEALLRLLLDQPEETEPPVGRAPVLGQRSHARPSPATPRPPTVPPQSAPAGGRTAGETTLDDAVRDIGPLFADVLTDGFTGREWLIKQIDRFLDDRPCGYLWVEGDAGVGKTALAAHLVCRRAWPGHFSRLTRGGSARVGLRNLAGQLVRRHGLEDLAPGGLLPERLCTPEGFETLLARAAERAEPPLVLVVDGVDEAEPVPGAQPWGLPVELPPGVFVVGTYRTGSPPPRCAAPTGVLRIRAHDPDNVSDLAEHVARVLQVANRADAGQVATELAERCGGVWVYLRYVLAEIRQGVRALTDLGRLPADLSRYYIDSLERWSQTADWHGALLPLLATLAVLDEPLPAPSLARLSGVDEDRVRWHCNSTLRPFLGAVNDLDGRGFALYHASLREFLVGERPQDEGPDQDWKWWDTLRAAGLAAHDRVAEHYLSSFGGLDTGLPALVAEPGTAAVDGGYPLRHLARHLVAAGRNEDLHRLLHAGDPSRPGPSAWFAAHDHNDTVEDFLSDVAAAGDLHARSTDRALAAGLPAPTLCDEAFYHLVSASVVSRTNAISADLAAALLAGGVWTTARAVAYARGLPTASTRGHVFAVLAAHSPDHARRELMDQALAAADGIASPYARAEVLLMLIPVDPDRRTELVGSAWHATTAIAGEHQLAGAVAELAPWLAADQIHAARSVAAGITNAHARASALTALAPYVRDQAATLADAMAAARAISGEQQRAEALADLAPHLSGAELTEALDVARAVTGHHRVIALAAVAARLPSPERDAVFDNALAMAVAVPAPAARAGVLAALARRLPDAVAHALTAVAALDGQDTGAEALIRLAPLLTERQLTDALRAFPSPRTHARCLTAHATHLPVGSREPAVRMAHRAAEAITDARYRAEALTRLAPMLPAPQRRDALVAALAAATAVATHGGGAHRVDRRDQPAGLAWPGPTDTYPLALLDRTSARADTDTWTAVLTTTSVRLRAPSPQRPAPVGVRGLSLAAVAAMGLDDAKAAALVALGPHLCGDDLAAAVTLAGAIADERSRSAALTGLVPHLLDAAQIDQALAVVPYGDRALLCAAVVRADAVVADNAEFIGLLRRALRATGRDTCVAILAAALRRLVALAGEDAADRLGAALRDAHHWWP